MKESLKKIFKSFYIHTIALFVKPKPGVHIINSHYITPHVFEKKNIKLFKSFINYLSKLNVTFITLQEAVTLLDNKSNNINRIFVALTFDDGFEECYTSIAPVLEKYDIKGTFFINSNYIESDETYQKKFNKRINNYSKKPMVWQQIIDLKKQGHTIGSHTLDHKNLSDLDSEEICFQILENKKILESKLNYSCEYFAWPYGQIKHFPTKALEITQKHHNYIFSGTNFKNNFSYEGKVINRRHLEPFWPKCFIKFFLSFKKI